MRITIFNRVVTIERNPHTVQREREALERIISGAAKSARDAHGGKLMISSISKRAAGQIMAHYRLKKK